MTVMRTPREDLGRQVDEQFIDLICTVEALVDLEFEAIVTADRTRCLLVVSDATDDLTRSGASGAARALARGRRLRRGAGNTPSERSPPR